MNKRLHSLTIPILLAVGSVAWQTASAANVRLQSGSLAFLKGVTQVNVEFDYSGMKVGLKEKEAVPEAEYVAQLNQKQPGRGDSWKREWVGLAPAYQLRFLELLNKHCEAGDVPLKFGSFKEAKYTLVLKTTIVLTGREGFMATAPFVSADAVFVEAANRGNVLAVVTLERMPGGGAWAFDMREAYAKAGKDLGIFLRRKVG